MGIPVSLVQPHINNRMVYGYGFNPDALNAVLSVQVTYPNLNHYCRSGL